MVKLLVLYGAPEDPEAFDCHYRETHTPLTLAMPELVSFAIGRPIQDDWPYYLVAELVYLDAEALARSMASDAGQAAVADLAEFADGGVTTITVDVETVGRSRAT